MAADYVVRLTGKDDLSSTIKQVKTELNEVGRTTSQIDKIDEKFNKIITSSAPLKRQLRDLQQIMAKMNLDGLSNTDQFTRIAEKAGELKDAMADASDAVSRFADDNFKLTAMADGLTMIAGAGSIATGAMGLLGAENERVQQAILKVQSALAILNGVQAIANKLNKDSALMHRIKQIRMAASAATTTSETAAITANTVATGANTASVVANTAATRAWNVAKAIAKALLGDWTGLVLVGVAGMAAYAIATSDATDAQEDQNKALKDGAKAQDTYTSTMANTYAQLMGKYQQLRHEWNSLSTDHQRNQWIKANQSAFNELGIEVNNVTSAEATFNANTSAVVEAFRKRAEAAAYAQLMTEAYRKQIELEQQARTEFEKKGVKAGDKYNGSFTADRGSGSSFNNYTANGGTIETRDGGATWFYTAKGAEAYNKALWENDAALKKLNDDYKANKINADEYAKKYAELSTVTKKVNTTPTSTTSHGNTTSSATPDPLAGSIGAMEKELQKLQSDLKNGFIPADAIDATKTKINELTESISKKKIELGFAVDPNIEKTKREAEDAQKKLEKTDEDFGKIKLTPTVSSFDAAVGNNDYNSKTIEGIQNQMNFNDGLLKQLQTIKAEYESLGESGAEGLAKVNAEIAKATAANEALAESAVELKDKQISWEKQKASLQTFGDVAGSVGSSFSTLGNAIKQSGDESTAAIMQMVATTAEGVSQILPQVMALIGAKEGEALASGTASAASMPYPANIAAIASIVATIIATFSSIASIMMGSFADGGIIGGSSRLYEFPIMAHTGEMVLNEKQQSNLFHAIENGEFGGGAVVGGEVKIKGSDLYVALKNYGAVKSKSGKNIGIK